MKKNIHPKYQDVLFIDSSSGKKWVCGSALQTKQTEKFNGKEYPVVYLSISSYSHPFYTGSRNTLVDADNRVGKFKKRYEKATAQAAGVQAQTGDQPKAETASKAKKETKAKK